MNEIHNFSKNPLFPNSGSNKIALRRTIFDAFSNEEKYEIKNF